MIKQKLENTTKEIFYIINNNYNFEDLNKEENYKKMLIQNAIYEFLIDYKEEILKANNL